MVLRQLLPAVDFSRVSGLCREHVIHLISEEWDDTSTSPALDDDIAHESLKAAQAFGDLEEGDHEWNEAPDGKESEPAVGDAVNGLTLEQSPSPLGSSSISAMLSALLVLCPPAKDRFLDLSRSFPQKQRQPPRESDALKVSPQHVSGGSTSIPPLLSTQQATIDGYFEQIHSLVPILDEAWFRTTLSSEERTDDGWKALSNIVFALGSIANGDDESHLIYYNRAREAIGYQTFASGSLELLQALILLGGVYLHYINAPNTAYLIMGTAFRMAIVMGLHRSSSGRIYPGSVSRAELKNRIWWSLVSADSWQGMMSDRPKLIKWDALTTITPLPTKHSDPSIQYSGLGEPLPSGSELADWHRASLRSKVELCKIVYKIQDRTNQLPPLSAKEVLSFDNQLQLWNKSQPLGFQSGRSCPKELRHSRDLRRCCFLTSLLCISRPHLLNLMNSATSHTFTSEDWKVVSLCLDTASMIIQEATSRSFHNKVSVWHSTFQLFQACLVLLFSITLAKRMERFSNSEICEWAQSLDRAIHTFKDMAPYKRPVDRYGEIIEVLYAGVMALGEERPGAAYQETSSASTEFIAMKLPDSLMDTFQPNMTSPNVSTDWFGFDFQFEDDITANFYPLPDI